MVEYFSFEDVLGELKLDEDELKRMVSEGELRAFRDENKMKFRKDDVENLRKGKVTEPTIILPAGEATGGGGDTAETLLDLDSMQEIAAPAGGGATDTAVPAADETSAGEGGAAETVAGETTGITEEMIFDDTDLTVSSDAGTADSQETMVESSEEDTGMTTQPLEVSEEAGEAGEEAESTVAEGEAVTEELGTEEEEAAPSKSRARSGARRSAVAPKPPGSPIMTGVLAVAMLVLGFVGVFLYDISRCTQRGEPGIPESTPLAPLGITESVADLIVQMLGITDIHVSEWHKQGGGSGGGGGGGTDGGGSTPSGEGGGSTETGGGSGDGSGAPSGEGGGGTDSGGGASGDGGGGGGTDGGTPPPESGGSSPDGGGSTEGGGN
ncbi:MAG: hypothetical protein HYY93_04265 [Planctomycetes bacterium]|nr:hypothetical protein [Planctomycetota bacterium]